MSNKDRYENKCGEGTTLTSDSVAQKDGQIQNMVSATLALSFHTLIKRL
jgi:hypothetical protein